MNPFNEKSFAEDKLSVVDVKARDANGAWYVIEMQTSIPVGLQNRLVFYTSELYSRQMAEGSSYGDLRPAISICFLTKALFPGHSAGHFRFVLSDLQHQVQLGDQLQLRLIELPKYDVAANELSEVDPFLKWIYFLSTSCATTAKSFVGCCRTPRF